MKKLLVLFFVYKVVWSVTDGPIFGRYALDYNEKMFLTKETANKFITEIKRADKVLGTDSEPRLEIIEAAK